MRTRCRCSSATAPRTSLPRCTIRSFSSSSGGYIVINPTEALVSIDINSGRATKEHGIEGTAVTTNLEAAHEIARQLRLRDMAGLVVIDFIDMEYGSNVRKVEKAMKDALKSDRARIQVGRISGFGLMEMSRQRLRTGVLEATTRSCPHCDGSGLVRTAGSAGLSALRLIEDEAAKGRGQVVISLYASTEAAVYLLNAKRADLADIEHRYGVNVEVIPEGENEGAKMRVVSSGPRNEFVPRFDPIADEVEDDFIIEDEEEEEFVSEDESRSSERGERSERSGEHSAEGDGKGRKRRKRRRGRNRDRAEDGSEVEAGEAEAEADDIDSMAAEGADAGEETAAETGDEQVEGEQATDDSDAPRKRRRRGGRRRRGRERGSEDSEAQDAEGETSDAGTEPAVDDDQPVTAEPEIADVVAEAEPVVEAAPKKRGRRKKADAVESVEAAPVAAEEPVEAPAKPKRTRRKKADAEAPAEAIEAPVDVAPEATEAPAKPKRTRRSKAADAAPTPTVTEQAGSAAPDAAAPKAEPEAAKDADGDTSQGGSDGEASDGKVRRGWWQRTFGN